MDRAVSKVFNGLSTAFSRGRPHAPHRPPPVPPPPRARRPVHPFADLDGPSRKEAAALVPDMVRSVHPGTAVLYGLRDEEVADYLADVGVGMDDTATPPGP